MTLRDGGVYRLINGTRFVARLNNQGGADLFTNNELAWAIVQAGYRVQPDENITYEGRPTPWRESDLIDTGMTYAAP
jgi:hypothetical protein